MRWRWSANPPGRKRAGYDHVQYGWEDYDFWCRLAERGHFGEAVPEVLADYRVHAASMLHTTTEVQDHKNDLIAESEAAASLDRCAF